MQNLQSLAHASIGYFCVCVSDIRQGLLLDSVGLYLTSEEHISPSLPNKTLVKTLHVSEIKICYACGALKSSLLR